MIFTIILFLLNALQCLSINSLQPQQIHLSLGANPIEMIITWTTVDKSQQLVNYNKIGGDVHTVTAVSTHFSDSNGYDVYIHRAKLTNLEPGSYYEYKCGNTLWSELFKFKTIDTSAHFSPSIAVYGDLGYENGVSIPQLKTDVKNGLYDAILHVGDIAYDLNTDGGSIGDLFMREIEPIAANVPYQVCGGNHEEIRNFTHYHNRFTMIDTHSGMINNHYYSFDIGPAHFIAFSTELYYWSEYFTQSHIKWQYQWLENDLKNATKPENRALRPWIITLGHRPMYCLHNNAKDCFNHETMIRRGLHDNVVETSYGLEDLFNTYGVDVSFWGHEHLYDRIYPIYNWKYYNGSAQDVYTNPKAPIHIITGAAGPHNRDGTLTTVPQWSAFYAPDYGYTRMVIHNGTHIYATNFSGTGQ
jgi:hypothetical protein